ncbi:MAG: YfcE family phosphodiesterase [Caldilineales bacterium]
MQIAILSDSHDNVWNLADALAQIAAADADLLLFCGDFCAPFTLTQIAQNFAGPVHAVLGNNDGDPRLLLENAAAAGNVTLHGQYAELTAAGRRIAINHYPEIARRLAESGQFDLVSYGHNHRAQIEQIGDTLLVNPGEVMGRFGAPSWALYNTDNGVCELRPVRHYPRTGGAAL